MIKRLVLKNWRSHEESEFVFSRGTNVLVGRMGAGKSSVMDAISFALFGTFPNLQTRKIKLDDCIMNKPVQKEKARVELEIELKSGVYRIVREITLGKGTTHAEIVKDGELLEGGNTSRVNEVIVNTLGINYELFSRAIYSEQNQIDYFLQIPRGKRREKIDELLGIDKFEDARKNLMSLRNRLKDRISDKKADLDVLEKENLPDKIKDIGREVNHLESEIQALNERLVRIRENYTKIKNEVSVLENARERLEKLKNERESIIGKLSVLQERIKTYEEKYSKYLEADLESKLASAREKMTKIKEKRENVESEIKRLTEKSASIESQLKDVENKKKKLEEAKKQLDELVSKLSKKEELQKKVDELRKRIEETKKKIAEDKANIDVLIEREEKLSEAEGACPVCGQPLETHKKEEIISHIRIEKEKLTDERTKLSEELSKLELELNELLRQQRDLDKLEGKRTILENNIDQIREELKLAETLPGELERIKGRLPDLEKELQEIKQSYDKLSELIPKLERLLEIKTDWVKSKQQIENIKKRISEIEVEEKSIKFNPKVYEEKKELLLNLASELSKIESEIKGKTELVNEKKKLLQEIKQKIEFVDSIREELIVLDEAIKNIDIMLATLETTQVAMREEFINAVNSALEDIWPRLYPYEDYKNLRLFVDGKDYILQLQRRDGNWVNVEGVASGGERSTAALALRVAFALILTQNLSWLILDEPTHNLDKEGVLTLAKTLKEHLPTLVEQIFIITHDEDMENAVSGTLYKLEREKGLDEPTRVVLVSSGWE